MNQLQRALLRVRESEGNLLTRDQQVIRRQGRLLWLRGGFRIIGRGDQTPLDRVKLYENRAAGVIHRPSPMYQWHWPTGTTMQRRFPVQLELPLRVHN